MPNKVMRFALGDYAPLAGTAVEGVNISQARYNAKIDHGENDLLTGFANPSNQVPYPMASVESSSICHDWSGNLYIVDPSVHAIYRIDEDNKLSIVAGLPNNSANLSNVTIKNPTTLINRAAFNAPQGICCDKSGNIYVADTGNHCIKMIANGNITLVAGSSVAGFVDNADGRLARFNAPRDVAIDKSGNLYVSDTLNHAIRKIYHGGEVMTVAGNGHAGNSCNVRASKYISTFDTPVCVSVDPSGNVYVIDGVNNFIKKITPNGWVYRFSGSGASGTSLGTNDAANGYTYSDNCSYEYLTGMDTDESGNVYVVDMGLSNTKSRLIKIDASGRPGIVIDFNAITDDWFIVDVACTPSQKLYVTVSGNQWAPEPSSSSSSTSYIENWSSSSTSESSEGGRQ